MVYSRSPGISGQLLLGEAESVPGAVVGADGPLAGHALVVLEARADARGSVAGPLRRALDLRVGVVGGHCLHRPGRAPTGGGLKRRLSERGIDSQIESQTDKQTDRQQCELLYAKIRTWDFVHQGVFAR